MNEKNEELYKTLVGLEKKLLQGNFDVNLELQHHKSDIDRLRDVVEELKKQELHLSSSLQSDVEDVGNRIYVTSDKLSELSNQLSYLETRLVTLEEHKDNADKRVWSYVEKVIIAIISGVMTMLFNNLY